MSRLAMNPSWELMSQLDGRKSRGIVHEQGMVVPLLLPVRLGFRRDHLQRSDIIQAAA